MLKLGNKVRLKTAKHSLRTSTFSDKRVDVDTDQILTVTEVTEACGVLRYACDPQKTGIHWFLEDEFELVEASTIETKFHLNDAVIVRITNAARVRNRARRKDVVSVGSQVPATIISVSLKGRDNERIDYLVRIDSETLAFIAESDIELKDYTLF